MKDSRRLTLEEKIGQLFVVGFQGYEPDSETRAVLDVFRPGGFILLQRNIESFDQIYDLTSRLREMFPIPPLLAIDHEGGRVDRLKHIFAPIPSMPELAGAGMAQLRLGARIIAAELEATGFNVNFGPVLDLRLPGSIVSERCLASTPGEVARLAGAFLEELSKKNIVPAPKHFPGLGGATVDPHFTLPRIDRNKRQLLQEDSVPFVSLFPQADMIMMSHAHYPGLGDEKPIPASLSSRVIEGFLRKKLGYKGLVVTDDMTMGAVTTVGLIPDLFLRAFEAAGIEAVPYKGPALAVYAYGKLALRRFVDLDILVRKADVLRAKELLSDRGFICETPWTETQQSILLRTQHNLSLSREEGRIFVELHWGVASSLFASSLQAEQLWERLQTARLNDVKVKSLSPEDLLLSLCVHGSKHFWERLAWICDVAELVKTRKDLDWTILFDRAVSSESDRMLMLGLLLANRLLEAPMPDHVKRKFQDDRSLITLAHEVVKRLFGAIGQVPVSIREGIRFNWALRASWRSRMRYCRLLLQPTDADIGTIPLPRALSFAYYLMRPFGLLRRDRERRLAATNDRRRLIKL